MRHFIKHNNESRTGIIHMAIASGEPNEMIAAFTQLP